MAIFRFFKMEHSAILDFRNFKFLTVVIVKRVELRHRAKFRRNGSNLDQDMATFTFFKMAAIRHLGFLMRVLEPPTKGIWWSLSLCKIWLESTQLLL